MTLHPDYPIETERLALRPFTRGDVDAVHEYRRREDVAEYLFDPPLSREECAEAVQQRPQDAAHMGVVVDDEEAQLVEVDPDHERPGMPANGAP